MPTTTTSRLPPPNSWEEFEDICKSSFSLRWGNPNLEKNGRQGQVQNGVDIYGRDSSQEFVGIQCKNTTSKISQKLIEEEVSKAERFTPQLDALFIATTADRDANIQTIARELSEKRIVKDKFPVYVVFWPDILHDLSKDIYVLRQHYPQWSSSSPAPTLYELRRRSDIGNITAFTRVIDFKFTCEYLRGGAKFIDLSILGQLDNMLLVKRSPTFILHDQKLFAAVDELTREWSNLSDLVHQAPYSLNKFHNAICFDMQDDYCRTQEENDLFENINKQISNLLRSINRFCQLINTTYPEISLEDTSLNARTRYSQI